MAIDIKFDLVGNPEPPTIILANRNGNKLGQLNVDEKSINLIDKFNDASEFTFTLNKFINGQITNLWDKVVDFKLVYCKEWDMWFEITVELDEATETVKTVYCTQLGQAELSQIMLYNIEINTEVDIARDDYKISILWDESDPKNSILGRLLEKAPHYSIAYVDPTIRNIQRNFSFDGTSIYDAFQEIAEEISCLFKFPSNSDGNGKIKREIFVYDLQQNCMDCGHRGEFIDECPNPECKSKNIKTGFGEDTLIFVTSDELASDGIQLVADTESVKNCFKLEAGDDLMTATIRNCNPNGTDYIWYFSDAVKEDMSDELVQRIEEYDVLYEDYYSSHVSNVDEDTLNNYNNLVEKYKEYYNTSSTCLNCDYEGKFYDECPNCGSDNILFGDSLQSISSPIEGYSSLMNASYNTIDLALYLESGLMPNIEMSGTSAGEQAKLLTASSLSPVAVTNVTTASLSTIESSVEAMARVIVKSTYKVEIKDDNISELVDEINGRCWRGNFTVVNYSDEEDIAISETVLVEINDDVETFIKQKIEKALNKEDVDDYSISGLFKKEYEDFCAELKKYALKPLNSFRDACMTCIDIMIQQGIANNSSWSDTDEGSEGNLYEKLYIPYYNKLSAIESEVSIRESEISDINKVQTNIEDCKNQIQTALNFQEFLGDDLWLEFCTYRREDKYSNDNYVSDGLNNAEIFEKALEFIEVAENEIYKSSELQHSISTTLNNLLAIPKFKPLIDFFKVGNWIRVQVDDKVYKLRMLEYEIDFGNFDNISVEFSDVVKIKNGITDVKSILSQASSMASSYDSVQRQANQGGDVHNTVNQWISEGLNSAHVRIKNNNDEHVTFGKEGLLCRVKDDISGEYLPEQLKLTHNIMAYTDDAWESVRLAIGKHDYIIYDEKQNQFVNKVGYGINADFVTAGVVSGSQIIGGDIYSDNYSTIDGTGSYLNLRDGTFSFGGGSLRYEGGKLLISSPDIPTTEQITEINEQYLKTTTVYAEELQVGSANIVGELTASQINTTGLIAENISGTTITGKNIMGGYLLIGDKNSTYAEITTDGILNCKGADITGNISIESGVSFSVESGGTVQISAGNSEGSYINFGEAFAVSKNGLSATSGNFTSLTVGGKNVVTEDKIGTKIVVSKTEPSQTGIVWIKPTTTYSANRVEYQGYTDYGRYFDTMCIANKEKKFNVSCNSSDVLPKSTYKYTVKFPIYLVDMQSVGAVERNIWLDVTATKTSDRSINVAFESLQVPSIYAWNAMDIEMTVESPYNLCENTSDIEIAIGARGCATTYNLYIDKEKYIYFTATAQEISSSIQPCEIYYKP